MTSDTASLPIDTLFASKLESFLPYVNADCLALKRMESLDRIYDNIQNESWAERHEQNKARVQQGDVDIIFIGDSIMHCWSSTLTLPSGEKCTGKKIWDENYAPRNAVNLGYGADQTGHVLWRLEHGELDGISPKVAVLLIGTNNCASVGILKSPVDGLDPATIPQNFLEVAAGIEEVCRTIRTKLPTTKILLLGVFPRDSIRKWADANAYLTNRLIEKLHDNEWIYFLDLADAFLDEKSHVRLDLLPDGIHPNEKGYAAWAEAMRPKLMELLQVEAP